MKAGWRSTCSFVGVESPAGREDLCRRRISQRVRQDELRHADSARGFEGWKVWTVGDDIAWIRA